MVKAAAGSFVTIPRGTTHTYKNNSPAPAGFPAPIYPSGIEHFFDELDRQIVSLPPDVAKVKSKEVFYRG